MKRKIREAGVVGVINGIAYAVCVLLLILAVAGIFIHHALFVSTGNADTGRYTAIYTDRY